MHIMLINGKELAERAFSEFQRIAATETANGTETLAYERLVPLFSTAPKAETEEWMGFIRSWSRNGHGQYVTEGGEHLRHWATQNGYRHS